MKIDWIKLKNYYITHEISLEELSKKYKVSISVVRQRSAKEKWVEQRDKKRIEIEQKVDEKFTEQAVNRKVAANEVHNELYQKGLEVAKLILDGYLKDLKEGKKKTNANAYNMDFIMKAIANAQKGQRLCLNIGADDNVDSQPEIKIIKGLDEDKI